MDFSDAVTVLRSIPIFAKVDPAELKLLAFASKSVTFEDGEVLFQKGEPADCAYLVHQGEVEVVVESGGRELVVANLGKNDLLGEMGIFTNSPRSASARAKGKLSVMCIEGDMFLRAVTENPDAALSVMRALCEKIADTTDLLYRG
ncbi:MAG: cyclic nucleotide-binding domain-containing protein [Acetobacterales bacterium]